MTLASATLQNIDGAFAAREYWKRAPGRRTLVHRFGSRLDVHQERYVRTFGPASSSPLTYHAIGRHDDATRRRGPVSARRQRSAPGRARALAVTGRRNGHTVVVDAARWRAVSDAAGLPAPGPLLAAEDTVTVTRADVFAVSDASIAEEN